MDDLDIDSLLEKALENNGQVVFEEPAAPEVPLLVVEKKGEKKEDKLEKREKKTTKRKHSRSRSPSRERSRDRRDRDGRDKRRRSRSRDGGDRHRRRRSRSRSPRRRDPYREREREKEREKRKREDERRKQKDTESQLSAAEREAVEIERDQRTVFAVNLPLKADEDDVAEFFSKVGKVRDVRLITDRNSRRSKGFGYIEFYDRATVPAALTLTGSHMMGHNIQVSITSSERNRLASAKAQPATVVSYGPTKLYVTNLSSKITEEDLHDIYRPFGDLENIVLHKDIAGQSKGFGFVMFVRPEEAKKAFIDTNGIEVAGKHIRVSLVNEKPLETAPQSMFGDLDDDEDKGVSMSTSTRIVLMEKLQRENDAIIQPEARRPVMKEVKPQEAPAPKKVSPSPCIKLSNMFDPENETEPDWDKELSDDIKDECSKYGSIVHIYVDKESQGVVYLKFGSVPAAQNAINGLNGRWFAARMIYAEFVSEKTYYTRFADAKYK